MNIAKKKISVAVAIRIFFLLWIFSSFPSYSSIPEPMGLNNQMKKDFLSLLSKAKDFHKVIKEGGKQASIQKETEDAKKILQRIYTQIPSMPHLHQRLHAQILLNSIEESILVFNSQGLKQQKGKNKVVKRLFNSFFELAEIYNLKHDVKNQIFYCTKDKSTWFQDGNKAVNPVNPSFKNCGRRL